MSRTKMTARIPTTPEVHEDLRDLRDESGASTYDELLRDWISQHRSEEHD